MNGERRSSLWRNHNYVVLWPGQAISQLGSGIQGIAFPLLVLYLTRSAADAGIAGALYSLPYLVFSLPAGVLVDRWNRKHVMMVCDTIRALNAASIPLCAAFWHLAVLQLFLNSFIEGTMFVFFSLAQLAGLPRVVPREQLPAASAQNQASMSAVSLIARSVGGFIYQTLGRTAPFLVNAVSYATSVPSLHLINAEFQKERVGSQRNLWPEMKEGLSWLWNEPVVRFTTLLTAGINVTAAPMGLILIVRARELHASPELIGAMLAIGSVGGLFGALLAPRLRQRLGFRHVMILTVWSQALAVLLFAIAPTAVVLGVISAALGVAGPLYNTVTMGYRLAMTPDQLQGRVNSAARMLAFSPIPLGNAIAGALLAALGAIPVILIFAAFRLVVALLATVASRMDWFPSSRQLLDDRTLKVAGNQGKDAKADPLDAVTAPPPEVAAVATRLKQLTMDERLVLRRRFAFDGGHYGTLDDVASELRLSKDGVKQIELSALRKLTLVSSA